MEANAERIDGRVLPDRQAQDPEAVWLYSDGVYRWAYEKDLIKNRYEMNYLLKILALVFGLTWALIAGMLLVMQVGEGWVIGLVTGICLGGGLLAVGITLLVQRISANARGGVDVVGFEMGEGGVRQMRSENARKVDRALETMTTLSGLVSNNTVVASNSGQIVSGTHPDITDYGSIRRVRVCPKYDVIDVTLKGNYKCRVYVRSEDLAFVKDYICARAPQSASR